MNEFQLNNSLLLYGRFCAHIQYENEICIFFFLSDFVFNFKTKTLTPNCSKLTQNPQKQQIASPSNLTTPLLSLVNIIQLYINLNCITINTMQNTLQAIMQEPSSPKEEAMANSCIQRLRHLKTLYDAELITQQDFETRKSQIVDELTGTSSGTL